MSDEDNQFQECAKNLFESQSQSQSQFFFKDQVSETITTINNKDVNCITECAAAIQRVLTTLTLYTYQKFIKLNKSDSKIDSTSFALGTNLLHTDGNTQMTPLSPFKPDAWITLETGVLPIDQNTPMATMNPSTPTSKTHDKFIHPLLIGEAKNDGDLAILRSGAIFKGSFVSPLFGYMSIYIIINHQHVELGLFSPLYNAPTKGDADTIICSHKFALTEESLNPGDPVDPDIFLYLDSLVQILFQFYQHFSLNLKMTHFTHRRSNSILRTYLLHVDGFSLPRDGSIFKIELPTTTSTTSTTSITSTISTTSTWKTDLNTNLTSYTETLSKIPSDKPHLLKRAPLTDSKATCHTNLLKYRNCNPFSSGLEQLYLLGPQIPYVYAVAADGVTPASTTVTNSSTASQSSHPYFIQSTIYFTIISVNCSDELIFQKWGEDVMSNTHFNLDHFKQVLGVVQALHCCGFIHCDIRSPNLVLTLENPTDPIGNMSLVDMEYVHCTKDQNSTFEPVKLYNTLRSVQYLEWFLGKSRQSNQLRFDLLDEYLRQGDLELAQAVQAPISSDLFQPNWTPNWFRLLDYYNLVRSFFEKDIAKWDTDSNSNIVRNPYASLYTMDVSTPLSQFIFATATFLLKMMSKNLPALGQGVQIDPKLDDDVIEWADELFAALQAAFKPATAQTVDVVANTLVITTKPTDDDDILPSPKENDDSNVVDHTNNLIVSPEGP